MTWRDALEKYGDRIRARTDAAPQLTPAQVAQLTAIIAGTRRPSPRRADKGDNQSQKAS